jgi:hypothetical protein
MWFPKLRDQLQIFDVHLTSNHWGVCLLCTVAVNLGCFHMVPLPSGTCRLGRLAI